MTDPKLQVTTYTYANDDTLSGVTYTNATTATPSVSFTYDTVYPRMATMTDGIGTTAYTYVPAGTLGAGQRATVDGPLVNDTITYTYDELGQVHMRTLSGVTDTWNYDALGRLQTEIDPIGTFTFTYDGVTSRLQQLAYPNGQTSTYSYFGNTGDRRLQDIHHQTGTGTTLSRFTYAYDGMGNITTWTQQYGADVKAYDFTYDAGDQLTGAVYRTMDATPVILKRYGYAYDATGNRTTARTDDAPILYGYNNLNQLTSQAGGGVVEFAGTTTEPASVTINGAATRDAGSSLFTGSTVLPSGTSTVTIAATDVSGNTATQLYDVDVATSTGTFTYDANGNLTAQGTKTFEWDAANRLVRVLDNGAELARFAYDGYGRRAQKITATTRSYVYDGMDIVEERVGAATTRTVQGPEIDQPLASVDGAGTVAYYLADHLGSIVQQTDVVGAVTLSRQYDPYGNPLAGGSTSGYAFTGREWDAETGLYYYRARYYDPGSATFISADPLGIGGGRNSHAYVYGNPARYRDPRGLDATAVFTWFGAGGLGSLSAGAAAAAAEAAAGAAVAVAAAGGWFVGRELAQLPVGNGRTVDDAVADAWSSLLFSGTIDVSGRPPFTGQPNTTVRGDRQTRRYGPDGYPETDVDTGHDHNNSGDPHSHDWSRPTDGTPPTAGNRSVARPWRPSDPPPPRQCPVKK